MTFEPRYLVCITTTGEYRIERTESGDWLAQWAGPKVVINDLPTLTHGLVSIDARDADGNAHDWESLELAQDACRTHRYLVANGSGPQEAADKVAADMLAIELRNREHEWHGGCL